MVGPVGGDGSSEPRIGTSCSNPTSSSPSPSSLPAFWASSLLRVIWPRGAAVVHTGLLPISLAIFAQDSFLRRRSAETFAVTSFRVIHPPAVGAANPIRRPCRDLAVILQNRNSWTWLLDARTPLSQRGRAGGRSDPRLDLGLQRRCRMSDDPRPRAGSRPCAVLTLT